MTIDLPDDVADYYEGLATSMGLSAAEAIALLLEGLVGRASSRRTTDDVMPLVWEWEVLPTRFTYYPPDPGGEKRP